jgi:putative flippase GtrA
VRTADGYEGQFWRRHSLVASTWRRTPFSQEAWVAFASGVAIDAPLPLLPDPIAVPLQPISFAWAGAGRDPDWAWSQTSRLARAAAMVTATVAAYLAGQAWHFETQRRHDVAAIAAARRAEQASVTIQRARGELAVVHAFRSRIPTETPVAAAAQALSILGQFGIQVSAWSVDDRTFRARLVLPDRLFSLQALATALEASPALRNVAPQIDSENMSIMLLADLEEGASRRAAGTRR